MTTTNLTIQMDTHLKNRADNVITDLFYSETNQARLHQAITDIESGKGQQHELIEIAE